MAEPQSIGLPALIASRAAEHAARLAIVDGAMRISYADLHHRTDRLAAVLSAKGIGRGDRVAMLLLDGVVAIELLIGCAKLGAIAVPINWRLAATEIAHILERSEPSLLVRSECFADLAATATMSVLIVSDQAFATSHYERLIGGANGVALSPVHGDVPLFMLFTSGTTGRPKACLQSHAAALAIGSALALRLALAPDDALLLTSPLFHVAGLSNVFATLVAGAPIVVVPRGASHEEVLRLISQEGCGFGSMNDALLAGICDVQDRLKLSIRMRRVIRGASITPASQIERIRRSLGARVIGGYGQTETLSFTLMLEGEEMLAEPTGLGWPLTHVEAAVLDEEGHPLCGAVTGELGIRSAAVMIGYWRDEAATATATGTGWLRTGDVVRRDAAGLFHFAGRTKELVKSGGENVYPREVEQVLLAHPAIEDAAIIGVPDERWGEAVKACIVTRPGASLEAAEAVAWCRQHIAGYKRPRYIEFIESVPRDHLGKIQRPKLREREVTADQKID